MMSCYSSNTFIQSTATIKTWREINKKKKIIVLNQWNKGNIGGIEEEGEGVGMMSSVVSLIAVVRLNGHTNS